MRQWDCIALTCLCHAYVSLSSLCSCYCASQCVCQNGIVAMSMRVPTSTTIKGCLTSHVWNADSACNVDAPDREQAINDDGDCAPCGTPNNGGCCLSTFNTDGNVGCTSANFQCVVTQPDVNPNGFCINCGTGNAPVGCPGELTTLTCTC